MRWRDVRVAEGARLESVCAGNRTGGSNPPLSVSFLSPDGRSAVTDRGTTCPSPGSDTPNETPESRPAKPSTSLIAVCWILGVGAVAATRFRGQWDAYRSIHQWAANNGIPSSLRNYDSLLIYILAAVIGAAIVSKTLGGRTTETLRLSGSQKGVGKMLALATAPMILGGIAVGLVRGGLSLDLSEAWPAFSSGVIRAPIGEELIFRGLLVACVARMFGWTGRAFWINAVFASLAFGSIHVPWNHDALGSLPAFLVTSAGGIWYVWLLARWRSLWVPMGLHAGMNLGWMLMGASGGAGGGGWIENILRVATIAVATTATLRMGKRVET